jgi:3-deoxy-manno-octulosonate cytidylyltransferase (CMP-KDO synthetase)
MQKKISVVGIIPARYASDRFPGKPLVQIAGKSLIQRTFENAKCSPSLDEILVATDDFRIFDHVKKFGGNVVMTSSHCPSGTERLAEVIRDTPRFHDAEIIINIQGDEPLLQPETIDRVITALKISPEAVMSTSVTPLSTEEEAFNYSVCKCVIDKNHHALYFSRALIPSGKTGKWQPNATYYKHMGIYGYRREFLLEYARLKPTPLQLTEDLEQLKVLEHGHKIKVIIVDTDSVGVDTPEDVKKIERLLL